MGAWSALALYLEQSPGDTDALELYDKYRVLQRDWASELVSATK